MRWLTSGFAASSAGHEALEEPLGPGQVGRQLLRMTLHRNDKPVVRLHAFDRTVLTLGGLMQARGEAADRLVVQAVDADLVLACGLAKLGRRVDLDGVRQVAAT